MRGGLARHDEADAVGMPAAVQVRGRHRRGMLVFRHVRLRLPQVGTEDGRLIDPALQHAHERLHQPQVPRHQFPDFQRQVAMDDLGPLTEDEAFVVRRDERHLARVEEDATMLPRFRIVVMPNGDDLHPAGRTAARQVDREQQLLLDRPQLASPGEHGTLVPREVNLVVLDLRRAKEEVTADVRRVDESAEHPMRGQPVVGRMLEEVVARRGVGRHVLQPLQMRRRE